MKIHGCIIGRAIVVMTLLVIGVGPMAHADDAQTFFDDGPVGEIRLTFAESDWYTMLFNSHASDPEDPYFPAAFEYDGVILDPVGVRFKGHSSFGIPGVKKSFKIDFNEFNDETRFFGLKKLNLDNGFKDPTMLREKLFLDFAAAFVPTPRGVHVRVFVNDTYWGLYTAVEQVDKTFAQSRFGSDEDGNLFKGAASDDLSGPGGDFGSDLKWLGPDPVPYHDHYQLKTNEESDDYSQLIAFIDVLNNQDPAGFPTVLEPLFDVHNALAALALNNLFVNLDSYLASAHNFYLYDRDDTGKITHVIWDTNEAFGNFLMGLAPGDDPHELDPFWMPAPVGPPPGVEQERPLMENLWANDGYADEYLCFMERMLDEGFDADSMLDRIESLADLIRADVYADTNKMYSSSEFEQNLYSDIPDGVGSIFGLFDFVQQRASYMNAKLDVLGVQCPAAPSDLAGILFINEFMADNDGTIEDPDEPGAFEDWIELFNAGHTTIDLGGMYLSDDLEEPTAWEIPAGTTIAPGQHLIFWADKDEEQGDAHTGFKLDADGEFIGIFESDANGNVAIDGRAFGEQLTDVAEGRCPDGADYWQVMDPATPGASNGCEALIFNDGFEFGDIDAWSSDRGAEGVNRLQNTAEITRFFTVGDKKLGRR